MNALLNIVRSPSIVVVIDRLAAPARGWNANVGTGSVDPNAAGPQP